MYKVGGVSMKLPIILGAGVCKSPVSLVPYLRSDVSVGALITGSYTPDEPDGQSRKGNDDGRNVCMWPQSLESNQAFQFGLNSWGMPNIGYSKAKAQLQMISFQVPLIVSIAAFSVRGYVDGLITFGQDTDFVSAIELNLGCPNAHDKKTSPISYDEESLNEILRSCGRLSTDRPVWVKVSPYLTMEDVEEIARLGIDATHVPIAEDGQLERVAQLIAEYPYIGAVVTSNTVPNGLYLVDGRPVTTPNGGKAGISGPILRRIAERQVARFRKALPPYMDVIHSGGIWHGDDVVSALRNKAQAVQCTSLPVWGGGPRSFTDLVAGSESLQNFLSADL